MAKTPKRRPAPTFVTRMAAHAVTKLPEGHEWFYELKLDGYRALLIKDSKQITILSRNEKGLTQMYPTEADIFAGPQTFSSISQRGRNSNNASSQVEQRGHAKVPVPRNFVCVTQAQAVQLAPIGTDDLNANRKTFCVEAGRNR